MHLKVYFVDDEIEILELFEALLIDLDLELKIFSCAQKALEAIKFDEPDLLIVDQRLPRLMGTQLAEQVSLKIPKVLITGDLLVLNAHLFIKIFNKPFCLKDLRKFIEIFFGDRLIINHKVS